MISKILCVPDLHFPWADMDAVEQVYKFNQKFKADLIIQLGDIFDFKAWSSFVKDADDDSGELEWQNAMKMAKEFEKMFPKITILPSNHDSRFLKRANEAGLISSMVRPLCEMVKAKDWKWHVGGDPLIIDNTAFSHGDSGGDTPISKACLLGMNWVQGHSHSKAGINWKQLFHRKIFGLDSGCLINKTGKGFRYAASNLSKSWIGFSYLWNGIPHLIPKI